MVSPGGRDIESKLMDRKQRLQQAEEYPKETSSLFADITLKPTN